MAIMDRWRDKCLKPVSRRTRAPGFTLIELVVVVAVLAIMAGIVVPAAAMAHGRASAGAAGKQLAVLLRRVQAEAQAGATRTRISLTTDAAYSVTVSRDGVWRQVESGSLGAVSCSTNFPGAAIEFSAHGWPCSLGSTVPRAGSVWLRSGLVVTTVVVQLTGGIRCE